VTIAGPSGTKGGELVESSASPSVVRQAILAVLAGTPLSQAAADVLMNPADLADAVELYQAAGYAALQALTARGGWHQVRIQFADWDAAEQAAAVHLGPELQRAEAGGILSSWWFIRKAPFWRLRCEAASAAQSADMKAHVTRALDQMLSRCVITGWQESIYEPEIHAFGGPDGITIAHRLFHADSCGVLGYISRLDLIEQGSSPGIGRRELSILLCSLLMRGARQDWYEQGDTWNRVQASRPLPPGTSHQRLREIRPLVRRLMTVDTERTGTLANEDGPLASASRWAVAFTTAGQALASGAHDGKLSRGLRDILAHHIIFHWNRIGLPARTQGILARAATEAVFGADPESDR
jgi:thiopeptide-type bacteriocin biosynthesis protein